MDAKLASGPATADLARELNDELVARFGLMLPSTALAKALGYPSAQAYRQAVVRGTVPVPLFRVAHRRGYFALARDVAAWVSAQRCAAAGHPEPAGSGNDASHT